MDTSEPCTLSASSFSKKQYRLLFWPFWIMKSFLKFMLDIGLYAPEPYAEYMGFDHRQCYAYLGLHEGDAIMD